MSTVAVYNMPAHGHINPTLPVVAELVRRGERVLTYGTPDLAAKLSSTRAEFRAYPPFAFDHERPPVNLGELARGLLRFAVDAAPALAEEARREGVRYVIHDSMAPWGRAVAAGLRLPSISSTTTFAIPRGVPRSPRYALLKAAIYAMAAPHLPAIRRDAARLGARFGTRPPGFMDLLRNQADRNLVYTSRRFQPFADALDASYRFVGPSLPEPAPMDPALADALGDAPLVYVSLGTLFNERPDFFRAALAGLAGFDGRVLLSIGAKLDPATLGPLPRNAIVRAHVPQLAVLRRASLFLTHGGMNSVSEGLCYGVPMLVYPQAGDQSLVASRVAAVGAGEVLRARDISPERIAARARRALATPSLRARAEEVGATLRAAGGAGEAVAQIEGFTREFVR